MTLDKYPILFDRDQTTYGFDSDGPKGLIPKLVSFTAIGMNIYNLSFGDVSEETGEMDDVVRSNNGDRNKVLATIAMTIFDFMSRHPGAHIFIEGNTPARTRLYQMAISYGYFDIAPIFGIRGYSNGKWGEFEVGGCYTAFVLFQK